MNLQQDYEHQISDNDQDTSQLHQVDVRHGSEILLSYDPITDRYIDYGTTISMCDTNILLSTKIKNYQQWFRQIITNPFLPEGVASNYRKFIYGCILQRLIDANVHAFGTQSLLMGLGIRNKRAALRLSAALNWVFKDALGKILRMMWASRMGPKLDPHAKRWRYRSVFIIALGSGLELMTYVYPNLFLLLATMVKSLKQMSSFTSMSTRNACITLLGMVRGRILRIYIELIIKVKSRWIETTKFKGNYNYTLDI